MSPIGGVALHEVRGRLKMAVIITNIKNATQFVRILYPIEKQTL
jgi:hypothetical protein